MTGGLPVQTIFERIFDKRNKKQRLDREAVNGSFHDEIDGLAVVEAHLLKVDVVVQVLDFLRQGHPVTLSLVEHIAQQLRELHHGGFSLLGLLTGQPADVVERVEEKMRADLQLQHGQFSRHFPQRHLLLLFAQAGMVPTQRDERTKHHDETERQRGAERTRPE